MRDWARGIPSRDWTSMAVATDGSYGIPEGIVYSFPVQCSDGAYRIVPGLDINEFSRARMQATLKELEEERGLVKNKFAS